MPRLKRGIFAPEGAIIPSNVKGFVGYTYSDMVEKLLAAVGLETPRMHEAAYLLAGFAFASQLLALVRDRLLAASFGAGGTLDIYYSAFRIPDFLFATVASLLSLYALLPVLSRLEQEKPGLMISFMRRTLLFFFVGMGLVSGAAFLLAPKLIAFIAPGLAGTASYGELLLLTRILLLQPVLLGASNILANLTQLRHRFLLYSVSPLLYNLGIIFGIVALYPHFGIAGLGWGVVLGAALHALVQVPFFARERGAEQMPFAQALRSLKEVLLLSVPRTVTLAAGQIALLALVALASLFSKGSIAVFSFAYNLQAVPLAIIGVSYSVAAFPTLSKLFASGDREGFVAQVSGALRHIMFWALPATVLVIVLRAQIVRVILGAGAFDWTATRLTAAALALFIISLLAQSIVLVLARAYYAAGNTSKPLIFATLSVLVAVASSYLLVNAFHTSVFFRSFLESLLRVADAGDTAVLMLALGYALGSLVQCAGLMALFARDFRLPLREFSRLFFQSFTAAVLGGAAAYTVLAMSAKVLDIQTTLGIFLQGFLGGVAGLAGTALVLLALRNRELAETVMAVRRRFLDTGPVALEPTDVAS